MPIYTWVADPNNNDPEELRKKRRTLQLGNNLRAWLTFASVVLMACQFGVRAVAVTIALSVAISFPLLWWARRYIPNSRRVGRVSRRRNPPSGARQIGGLRCANPPYGLTNKQRLSRC